MVDQQEVNPYSHDCHCNFYPLWVLFINAPLFGISPNMSYWFIAPCLLPGGLHVCTEHLSHFYSFFKTNSHIITSMQTLSLSQKKSSYLHALCLVHTSITAQIALYYTDVWSCLSSLFDSEFLVGWEWDLLVFIYLPLIDCLRHIDPLLMFAKWHRKIF